MMLSAALAEMIDNTERIVFYNTPNSVCLANNLNSIKKQSLKAPSIRVDCAFPPDNP